MIILLMDIMNRDINMINLACEVVLFYNVNYRFNVFVDGNWSIGD